MAGMQTRPSKINNIIYLIDDYGDDIKNTTAKLTLSLPKIFNIKMSE